MQAHVGIGALKLGEHLRQKLVGALHGQAEAQKPGLPAGKRGEGFVHLRFDLQKAARGLHVDLPGGRERNGRGAPLEDGLAELLLDLPNLLGERRLGDKERFCRGGEAAFADNGEHELSVACIHGGFPLCDLMTRRAQSADIPILRKIGENVNHKNRAISRNFRNIKKEEKRLSRRRGMGV